MLSPFVNHHINDHRNGKNQDVIFTGGDVHAVGIGNTEPLLRDFRSYDSAKQDSRSFAEQLSSHPD